MLRSGDITEDKILDILDSEPHASSLNYDQYISESDIHQVDAGDVLINRLTDLTEVEEGGRIAITGFVYQMLIAIEYIVQMLKGEWDFVAVELHDDIVVGKGDNHIRFIQVKSSKRPHQNVSDTGLYERSNFTENDEKFYKNDSWADKLLSKAHHFPIASGCKCEFEIATSYHFLKGSAQTDVSRYEDKFPEEVPDDDVLLKKLSNPCVDKLNNLFDFNNYCGEPLQSLLTRFRIKKYPDAGDKIDDYMVSIRSKFGALISEDAQLSPAHLRQLIGILLENCLTKNGKHMLYITREKAEDIKLDFKHRILASFGQQHRSNESTEVLKNVFTDLHTQANVKHEIYSDFQYEIAKCHEVVITWVDEEPGDVDMLLSRYGHGTKRTLIVSPVERDRRLGTLFRGNIFLNVVNGCPAIIVRGNSTLLIKSIGPKHVSFLHVDRAQTFDGGCEKLRSIVERAPDDEKLSLMASKPMTIIDGHVDNVQTAKTVSVTSLDKQVDELGQESDLTKPPVEFQVVPGKLIQQEYEESLYACDCLDDVRDKWIRRLESLLGGQINV